MVVGIVGIAGIVAACAACAAATDDTGDPATTAATTAVATPLVATTDYLPGVAADVYLPQASGVVPLVVMVPGGAWIAADRAGLGPLAERLATDGMAVVNATHRPAGGDVHFPDPVQDVVCSVQFAVARTQAAGFEPHPVVVLGHSSGAHLAALAVLAPDHFRGQCEYPSVAADALAGLAGTYDVAQLVSLARPLFGVSPDEDPAMWSDGNPMNWVEQRSAVPVFVGHGDADDLVPLSFSRAFADALQQAEHAVHIEVVPGADHHRIYEPGAIEAALSNWIRSLS